MYTYGMYTYGMYTYGMYTYGMYTHGMYSRVHISSDSLFSKILRKPAIFQK